MKIVDERYEIIISSMRVLTLLGAFKNKKSYLMTFDKLMLLDFYMRFPQTMINKKSSENNFDFEELYSFYHSHPDRENYNKVLNYLISKNLIDKDIIGSSFIYRINDNGYNLLKEIDNPYAIKMQENALIIKRDISGLNESKMIEEINSKSLENIKLI